MDRTEAAVDRKLRPRNTAILAVCAFLSGYGVALFVHGEQGIDAHDHADIQRPAVLPEGDAFPFPAQVLADEVSTEVAGEVVDDAAFEAAELVRLSSPAAWSKLSNRHAEAIRLIEAFEKPAGLIACMQEMLHSTAESPRWRNYCVQYLTTLWELHRDDRCVEALIFAAGHPEADIAEMGIHCMARLLHSEQVPGGSSERFKQAILDCRSHGDPRMRNAFARSVGTAQLSEGEPYLLERIADTQELSYVRAACIDALVQLGRALPPDLVNVLHGDESPNVQAALRRSIQPPAAGQR